MLAKPREQIMSWDIFIANFPADVASVKDMPKDFKISPIGPRSEVIARVQELLPETDFKDPTWGVLDGEDFSIEFIMGHKEICDSITLFVRGGGSTAMTIVARLLQHLKLRGIDCQTSDFFRQDAAEDSFRRWQAYRDRVIQKQTGQGRRE